MHWFTVTLYSSVLSPFGFQPCSLTPCAHRPRYQHYLESVLEVADEYGEVADLLLRHATLSATNTDLKEHQRKCSELAEKVRVRVCGIANRAAALGGYLIREVLETRCGHIHGRADGALARRSQRRDKSGGDHGGRGRGPWQHGGGKVKQLRSAHATCSRVQCLWWL